MARQKILTLTRDNFEWQFFRAGGAGGQKQNKTSSACRCVHAPSGSMGESREERSQNQNRRIAFKRCTGSVKFQSWLRVTCSAILKGFKDVEAQVDLMMKEENLKIEYYNPNS